MSEFVFFQFSSATGIYLIAYLATLCIHMIFFHYVLAGSGYIALVSLSSLFKKSKNIQNTHVLQQDSVAFLHILKDWMPFYLSGAITAGIGPLLFIQILYQKEFYSSNLLLFKAWGTLLPGLLVAFYLLYFLKNRTYSKPEEKKVIERGILIGIPFVVVLCFLWVAFLWSSNHLLSLQSQKWPELYAKEGFFLYTEPQSLLRLLFWCIASCPTLAAVLLLQGVRKDEPRQIIEKLPLFGLIGNILFVSAVIVIFKTENPVSQVLLGKNIYNSSQLVLSLFYLIKFIESSIWLGLFVYRKSLVLALYKLFSKIIFTLLTISLFIVCMLRELIRITAINLLDRLDYHSALFSNGGVFVFLTFVIIGTGTILWCLYLITYKKIV
jgi:hypothetical protein